MVTLHLTQRELTETRACHENHENVRYVLIDRSSWAEVLLFAQHDTMGKLEWLLLRWLETEPSR